MSHLIKGTLKQELPNYKNRQILNVYNYKTKKVIES